MKLGGRILAGHGRHMRAAGGLLLCGLLLLTLFASMAFAQTSSTGAVVGTVTDSSGAVVAKATVTLTNPDTNTSYSAPTSDSGQYVFPNVPPGNYQLSVKAQGFRTSSVPALVVSVNKSVNVPVRLEVGAASETVEVQATAQVELQTTDAQLGNIISRESISKLPTLQRTVVELMNLQPGVAPPNGQLALGMRVTGAIDDQNTVKLDGIDITANVVASRTVVPTPTEAVEEFRIAVSNPTQELGRASGGQVTLVGRRGTNTFHGAGYWTHQNDDLNANTWDNNFSKIKKPELKDNRFGGRLGGPIFKDKTFFFTMYEGRRFPSITQVNRAVPTDSLKAGILKFRDNAGNIQSFDLATAAACGPTGASACDPRGLGISPYTKSFWALMPTGNTSGGDGLNTTGYLANIPTPQKEDYATFRLDHNFTDKLKFNGTYTYWRRLLDNNTQIDIRGGGGLGKSVIHSPIRGELISGVATWQIHPTLLNTFRFGYVWNRNSGQATSPTAGQTLLGLSGVNTSSGIVAALPASNQNNGILDSPVDMDTQRARFQSDNDKDIQYIDDVNWIRGNHSVQFGGQINHLPYTHVRADKVVGSLTSLVATMDAGSFLSIPAINTPRTCSSTSSGAIQTNCIRSADANTWARLYAATLGLVDNVSVLATFDSNLKPLPLGTPLTNITTQNVYYFYGQDSWRITPSLTVTYGLSYGWNTPPTEKLGRQTLMIDAGTGQVLSAQSYLSQKLNAALGGNIYNPTFGFVPVGKAGRPVFNTDRSNIAPRASFAWNPQGHAPLVGRLLGERKTVIRGGFALVYDRSNTVQSVEIPMLGVGFDQNINVGTPVCTATGAGGAGCNAAVGTNTNPGLASFRVGVDGTIPLPTVPTVTTPVIPATNFSETLSFQVDPETKVGRTYNIDLGFQRELPGNMVLEASYAGRFARHLPQAVNLNASPYFFVDKTSGQTFAQAYDAVATQLRNGTPVASVTVQPWFENQLAAVTTTQPSKTALLLSSQANNFITGNVSTIFQRLGILRRSAGLLPYNNDQTQTAFMRTYLGQSNYNGLLVSLRNRTTHGLSYSLNYTFARTLDDNIANQNNAGFYSNSYHPGVDYGPSTFDRTHVINANYVYDLPLGKGHRLFSGPVVNKIFGGWFNSGIFQYASGLPLFVSQGVNAWGGGLILAPASNAVPVNLGSLPSSSLHSGVTGSNGIGVNADPAHKPTGGAGLDMFADPAAAFGMFRRILLASDTRTGKGQNMRGIGFWNLDTTIGKTTAITERVSMRFSFDFFNVFNHHNFLTPAPTLTNQGGFGVVTATNTLPNRTNSARWIEFSARIDF